ncbi:Calcium-independent receptor for alpha-latrotoxin [Carabus blaptoides fortunei]
MANVKLILKIILSLVVLSVWIITCNASMSANSVIACEHEMAELKCENGKIVHILDVNYGRTTRSTCTDGPISNTTCYTEDATDIVSDNLKCERKTARLECEQGKVIRILDANFGRKSRIICPDGPVYTTDCHSKNSLPIVVDKCENKRSCNIFVSSNVFGNPCPNTYKYLSVRYECVKESVKSISTEENYDVRRTNDFRCNDGSAIRKSYICNGIADCSDGEDEFDCDYESQYACEGKTLNLNCNGGEVIRLINGNYGRLSTKICPRDTQTKRVNCEAANVYDILENMCDGKESCRVRSANSVFGDPCPDIYKYTEVHYKCVKDPMDASRFLRVVLGYDM